MKTLTLSFIIMYNRYNDEHIYMKQVLENPLLQNLSDITNNFIKLIDEKNEIPGYVTCFLDFEFKTKYGSFMKRIEIYGISNRYSQYVHGSWLYTKSEECVKKIICEISEACERINKLDE